MTANEWAVMSGSENKKLAAKYIELSGHKISTNSSVIRQKDEFQNGCCKKTEHVNFSEKKNFFYPLMHTRTFAYHACVRIRG